MYGSISSQFCVLQPLRRSVSVQAPLAIRGSSSLLIPSFQKLAFMDSIASLYVFGSSSMRYTFTICLFNTSMSTKKAMTKSGPKLVLVLGLLLRLGSCSRLLYYALLRDEVDVASKHLFIEVFKGKICSKNSTSRNPLMAPNPKSSFRINLYASLL